jgi:hypothetical protein
LDKGGPFDDNGTLNQKQQADGEQLKGQVVIYSISCKTLQADIILHEKVTGS